MFEIRPFKKEDVLPLLEQPINHGVREFFLSGAADQMEAVGGMISIFVDGECTACGGIAQYWEGRGQMWGVFSEKTKGNFLPTFRAIKEFIKVSQAKYRRIEMSVDQGVILSHKRARLLGFTLEAKLMRKYLPSGGNCSLYALVREDG